MKIMEPFPKANNEMPAGLKMELTQNLNALNRFAGLPTSGQSAFIEGARKIRSKQEMRAYVDKLTHL